MFASHVTDRITVAGSDGAPIIVTIKKLNWKKLTEASDVQSARAMATAVKAGAEMMKLWREDPKDATPKDDPEARYRTYDRETVLVAGIKEWTAQVALKDGIADLDEPVADRLHRAILDLSLGPATKGGREAAQGEG